MAGTAFPEQFCCLDNVSSLFCPDRETNSGLRGIWVYEIGTSPYFTNVAPGEVTDLPTEATPQGPPEDYEEAANARRPVYNDGQQVQYPPYESEGEQIEVHPIQYQPHQPDNQEVLVVDDPDINVDGESTGESYQCNFPLCTLT